MDSHEVIFFFWQPKRAIGRLRTLESKTGFSEPIDKADSSRELAADKIQVN